MGDATARWGTMVVAFLSIASTADAAPSQLPAAIARNLPDGYRVITMAHSRPDAGHDFVFVALAARTEGRASDAAEAPLRPLLIFRKQAIGYRLIGRNDHVILRANEGGQCDPFEDGNIATKGRYVTIENGVACGQHWTDYVTFRFAPRSGAFLFDNERGESWSLNPDQRPNAEAMIRDGGWIYRAGSRRVSFADWRHRH